MSAYDGFLFSKLQAIGTRSEGPNYYLQLFDYTELVVEKKVPLWRPDETLQKHLASKVTITGKLSEGRLAYDSIVPYSRSTALKTEEPSLVVELTVEDREVWVNKMPPSPPPTPLKISLDVTWPYRSVWKGLCPSSQLYDFFVEKDGEPVWQWGRDRIFSTVLTPVMIPGGSPNTYTETWLIDPRIIQAEGTYTVRGLFIASGQEAEQEIEIRFAH